jgi:hypothetical protein
MNEIRARLFGRREDASPLVDSKRPSGARGDNGLSSVSVPRQETRTQNTRRGDRHRLSEEMAVVVHAGKLREVQLINLSGGGAMVTGEGFSPSLWDRADLSLGEGSTVECAVRWIKGDRVGLEFAHETQLDCPDEERSSLLRAVLDRSFPSEAAKSRPSEATDAAPQVENENRGSGLRHPLIWSGTLHYDYESTRVRLRNISQSGALIDCSKALPVGAEPLLDLGEAGSFFATVTWTRGDQAGLKFREPFDLSSLARAKPQVAATRWVKPPYLRNAGEASPWDQHWQRLSLGELSSELDGFLKR